MTSCPCVRVRVNQMYFQVAKLFNRKKKKLAGTKLQLQLEIRVAAIVWARQQLPRLPARRLVWLARLSSSRSTWLWLSLSKFEWIEMNQSLLLLKLNSILPKANCKQSCSHQHKRNSISNSISLSSHSPSGRLINTISMVTIALLFSSLLFSSHLMGAHTVWSSAKLSRLLVTLCTCP